MNEKIKELMIESGFAAPELAGRANKLVDRLIRQCIFELVHESTLQSNKEVQDFTVNVVNRIKERFGIE